MDAEQNATVLVSAPVRDLGLPEELLARLNEVAADRGEPVKVVTWWPEGPWVDLHMADPVDLCGWQSALGFSGPVVEWCPHLRQTMTMSRGELHGWQVTLRHIQTQPVLESLPAPKFIKKSRPPRNQRPELVPVSAGAA